MHREIARRRVLAARVARLATIDPDGRPHVVPIVFVLDGETLYTAVDAKPKRSPRLSLDPPWGYVRLSLLGRRERSWRRAWLLVGLPGSD